MTSGKRVFEDGDEVLVEALLKDGFSYRDIAKKWDCCKTTIERFVGKHNLRGIVKKGRPYSDEDHYASLD